MDKINLDNCSTTKPYNEILELFIDLNKKFYFNANSGSNDAYKTNIILQRSKKKISELLDFEGEIVHTSGATESNNIIIQGFFKNNVNRINRFITTEIEHPSIYEVSKNLGECDIDYIDFTNEEINLSQLEKSLKKGPALVSLCLVNNNTGTIINSSKVYELVKKYNSYLHLDVTQAIAKIPIDFSLFDFASCSMHKIHGLKGVGLIFKNTDAKISNLVYGGGSDSDIRPGTINTPGYITSSRTIERSLENYDKFISHICKINLYVRQQLLTMEEDISINTSYDKTSPFIINFSLKNIGSEVLLNYFEKNDIIISSGSACSTKVKSKTEVIMKKFGVKYYKNNVRICFEYNTTMFEIERFLKILRKAVKEL